MNTCSTPITPGRCRKKTELEVGYIGRIGQRQIVQQDYGQPLSNFTDPPVRPDLDAGRRAARLSLRHRA